MGYSFIQLPKTLSTQLNRHCLRVSIDLAAILSCKRGSSSSRLEPMHVDDETTIVLPGNLFIYRGDYLHRADEMATCVVRHDEVEHFMHPH